MAQLPLIYRAKYFCIMEEKNILSGICLVEIGGESCAGCHALMPEAREAAKKADIPFYYFDAAEAATLIERWQVQTVPSLYLTDCGVPFASCRGYQPQEILGYWIEYKIQEHKNGK